MKIRTGLFVVDSFADKADGCKLEKRNKGVASAKRPDAPST